MNCHHDQTHDSGKEKAVAVNVVVSRVEEVSLVEVVHDVDLPAHVGMGVTLIVHHVWPSRIRRHLTEKKSSEKKALN